MRRGRRWRWALALGLGLGLTALAHADEDDGKPPKTGNWFTRLFTRADSAKKKDEAAHKDETAPAAVSPALVRQKACWEWQRRMEVCYKLKQIALETGDRDLDRKADALDQRAWDIYVQRTGGTKGSLAPTEQLVGGRLGLETAQRSRDTPITAATPGARDTASPTLESRIAARGE